VWFDLGKIPSVPTASSARDITALGALYASNPVPAPSPPTFRRVANPAKAKPAVATKKVTIHFATGSAQIEPEPGAALRELSGLAERMSNAYLRIEGNTDNVGSASTNTRLSRARAQAVANRLVAQGFDRNRFIVIGNGPSRPVASNATEAGRARNRRTEVKVIPR
jgi:NitT/TauT family transport system substrate-binding protein